MNKKKKKYKFNKNITGELKGFKTHLQKLGYGENSIMQKSNYAGYFLNWLENENLQIEDTRYNDLLSFIDYCKLADDSKKLINNKLRSIRNFYEYLKEQNPNITNPAVNLHLKGIRHKIPSNIISFTELEKLYNNYKTETTKGQTQQSNLGPVDLPGHYHRGTAPAGTKSPGTKKG